MLEKATHLASIGVMTAGITHEINQPLNAIKICADSLLFSEEMKPGTIPSTYLEDIQQISDSANRIEEIIRHLRSYWDKQNEEEYLNPEIEANQVIRKVLELLNRQLISHGIELELDMQTGDCQVKCNKIQIEQIVINIVNNSLQALNTIHLDKKIIRVKTSKRSEDEFVIQISDNGPGIKDEIADHVFDPFFTTKRPGKGMGLGLAIVKEILDGIGGAITINKNVSEGACFVITLPCRRN